MQDLMFTPQHSKKIKPKLSRSEKPLLTNITIIPVLTNIRSAQKQPKKKLSLPPSELNQDLTFGKKRLKQHNRSQMQVNTKGSQPLRQIRKNLMSSGSLSRLHTMPILVLEIMNLIKNTLKVRVYVLLP